MRIFLASAAQITRAGLKSVLLEIPGFTIVGEASSPRAAFQGIAELEPDIILIDVSSPQFHGYGLERRIKRALPNAKILVLNTAGEHSDLMHIFKAGALGYCVLSMSGERLEAALRAVAEGAIWIDLPLASSLLKEAVTQYRQYRHRTTTPRNNYSLSRREKQILHLIVGGYKNSEIASRQKISEETVKTHLQRIMRKLKVKNRTQIAVVAVREGLVRERNTIAANKKK